MGEGTVGCADILRAASNDARGGRRVEPPQGRSKNGVDELLVDLAGRANDTEDVDTDTEGVGQARTNDEYNKHAKVAE